MIDYASINNLLDAGNPEHSELLLAVAAHEQAAKAEEATTAAELAAEKELAETATADAARLRTINEKLLEALPLGAPPVKAHAPGAGGVSAVDKLKSLLTS